VGLGVTLKCTIRRRPRSMTNSNRSLKPSQRLGSCANHCRSPLPGASVRHQPSRRACCLLTPRGQRSSTRMRVPSRAVGES
jgi:hypothetical protein